MNLRYQFLFKKLDLYIYIYIYIYIYVHVYEIIKKYMICSDLNALVVYQNIDFMVIL